jgi:hypothetical protein
LLEVSDQSQRANGKDLATDFGVAASIGTSNGGEKALSRNQGQ